MTEDTKLILDKLNAIEEHMNTIDTELRTISNRFDIVDEKLNAVHTDMTHEFEAVRYEMQTAFNELNSKLGDVRKVTETNCYELTLLKAKA